ncbi:MAG: GrpB family protein [Lautropia sp.]
MGGSVSPRAPAPEWQDRIAFRDLLRSDPALRVAYEALKVDLAQRAPNRDAYTEGKAPFIREALSRQAAVSRTTPSTSPGPKPVP